MLLFFSLQRIPLNLREPLCLKLASPIIRQTMIRLAATSYLSWYNKATGGLLILPYFYIRSIYSSRFSLSFSIVRWEGSCPKSLPRKIPLLLVPQGSNNIFWKERSYLLNIKYEYRDFAKSIAILSP